MIADGGTVSVQASCPQSPRILSRGIADPSSVSGPPGTGHSGIAVGVHDYRPVLWFTIYLTAAVLFAIIWKHVLGQGPLERLVSMAARGRRLLPPPAGT